MKCVLTGVIAGVACAWCSRKTDCVVATIDATFFHRKPLCWKCLRRAIEMRHQQDQQTGSDPSQATASKAPAIKENLRESK